MTALKTTCSTISHPVFILFYHSNLLYVSTAPRTTHYAISDPVFLHGDLLCAKRPSTRPLILTFSLYASYTPSQLFTFTPSQSCNNYRFLLSLRFLFCVLILNEPVLWETSPGDQRQIQTRYQGINNRFNKISGDQDRLYDRADWIRGWICFLAASFPWIYVMGNGRWDTLLASYVFSFWVLNLLYHREPVPCYMNETVWVSNQSPQTSPNAHSHRFPGTAVVHTCTKNVTISA